MNLAQVLSAYFNLNILILAGFISLKIFTLALKKLGLRMESSSELKLHYVTLAMVLLLTAVLPFLPHNEIFSPAAKIWSAPSIQSFTDEYQGPEKSGYLILPTPVGPSTISAHQLTLAWSVIGAVLFLMGVFSIFREIRVLLEAQRHSFLIRKIGRVCVFVNDNIHVPFSFWLQGKANVVLPTALIGRREEYQIVMAHELQHHRQGDTQWVYVMWALKFVGFMNPAIYLWNRWISEIQEFACDETLVDQKKVDSQAYAGCLVEVAQTAINQKSVPVCATGLTFLIERNLLHRRIEKMFTKSSTKIGRSIIIAFGIVIASIMGAVSYASNGFVQDRRVTLAQAKEMALRAQSETGFPVAINDLVLKQLNRYIGTPEGREFMRNSLTRMENYKVLVGDSLKKYGVPVEIMAVPITESGYQNLREQSHSPVKAAGIWQFIRQTARNYGLRVDSQMDERLDVGLLTDAAMRYLQSNNLRFKDWQLSLLAYNMGENAVQKAINSVGTRDAWTLIRNGYEGDKDYLAKVMAAILIMKNPESVQ